jgi:hypothetical protein
MEQISIPIGTTIHIHGMPYKTTSNIIVLGKKENYERTFLSQSDPSLDSPFHAASPESFATNSLSLESMKEDR